MNYFKVSALAVLFSVGCSSVVAQAAPLGVGAAVIYSQSPYKGGDDHYLPFPNINYDGDSFYIHGLQGGYYLWKDPANQLSLTILGSSQNFKRGDTNNRQLKQLDNRRMTMMGGLAYRHVAEWGIVRTMIAGDMLDNSDGFLGDMAYLYRFQQGAFSLIPGIGVQYNSSNQNDYYYGVSYAESRRSGLEHYKADDSWNPYLELTANWAINRSWNATVGGRYTRLSSEVKDSPMVSKSSQASVWTGLSYTF